MTITITNGTTRRWPLMMITDGGKNTLRTVTATWRAGGEDLDVDGKSAEAQCRGQSGERRADVQCQRFVQLSPGHDYTAGPFTTSHGGTAKSGVATGDDHITNVKRAPGGSE